MAHLHQHRSRTWAVPCWMVWSLPWTAWDPGVSEVVMIRKRDDQEYAKKWSDSDFHTHFISFSYSKVDYCWFWSYCQNCNCSCCWNVVVEDQQMHRMMGCRHVRGSWSEAAQMTKAFQPLGGQALGWKKVTVQPTKEPIKLGFWPFWPTLQNHRWIEVLGHTQSGRSCVLRFRHIQCWKCRWALLSSRLTGRLSLTVWMMNSDSNRGVLMKWRKCRPPCAFEILELPTSLLFKMKQRRWCDLMWSDVQFDVSNSFQFLAILFGSQLLTCQVLLIFLALSCSQVQMAEKLLKALRAEMVWTDTFDDMLVEKTRWSPRTRMPTRMSRKRDLILTCH